MQVEIGVIGGTGVYELPLPAGMIEEKILSQFGEVLVKVGKIGDLPVAFLARHGAGHVVPPHLINYRANIKALQILGVKKIIATGAVGSMDLAYQPGDFVVINQFIDFTKNRLMTFYEGGEQGVVHVDMTEPYCPELRAQLIRAASQARIPVKSGRVTYVCTEGPRFETPAEINMYQQLGGQVVGMTSVPEVILAREAEICYATIGMVTNFAAGVTCNILTHEEVVTTMKKSQNKLRDLIVTAISIAGENKWDCHCQNAISELGKFD